MPVAADQHELMFLLPLCAPLDLLGYMNSQMKPVEARTEQAVLSIFTQVSHWAATQRLTWWTNAALCGSASHALSAIGTSRFKGVPNLTPSVTERDAAADKRVPEHDN